MTTNAGPAIAIRAARPADRRAVRALCRRIWSDDYVPAAFDEWVRDRRGRLWVACIAGRVVGVAKLTLLGRREAWLHGLRVDAGARRRGVATALLAHRLERARRLGARVARLDTAADNVAVRRLMRRFGFALLGRFAYFGAAARAVEPPRRARVPELASLWRIARRDGGLVAARFTRRAVGRADLASAIRDGRCVVSPANARPAALAIVEPYQDRLRARFLAGRGPALRALLRSLPGEARRLGEGRVGFALPAPRWRAAEAAGYRRGYRRPNEEAMLIFERALRPSRAAR